MYYMYGKFYSFHHVNLTYAEAKEFCLQKNARLPILESQIEQMFMQDFKGTVLRTLDLQNAVLAALEINKTWSLYAERLIFSRLILISTYDNIRKLSN